MKALCWAVWSLIALSSCGGTDFPLDDNPHVVEDRTCRVDDLLPVGRSALHWAAACVFESRSCVDQRDIVCQIKTPGRATYELRLSQYQTACPKCLPSYLCVSREERRCASLVIHKKPNGSVSPKERNDIKEVRPEEMENAIPAKQLKNAPFLLNGYQTNWTECRISKNDRFSSMQSMTGSPSTSMVIFLLMHGLKYYIEQIEIPLQGTPQIQSKWKIPGQNQEDIKWESLHTGTCLNNKGKCLLLFGTAEICHHLIVYSLKEPSTDNAIVITGTARFTSDWANVFCSSWMFDNNENFGMALYWRIFEPKMYLITVNESRITLNVTQTPETVNLSLYNIQWHPSGRYGIAMRGNQLLLIHYKDNEQKIVQKVRVNSFRPGMAITKSLAVVCEDEVGRYTCKMNQFTK